MTKLLVYWVYGVLMFIFTLITSVSYAESSNLTVLEAITVTAEKFPTEEKNSPRFVSIISSEKLKTTGANNLVDALRRTGIFAYKALAPMGISHGGMNSELMIRGLPGGELILLNGVPIQGAAGHGYDLNMIPVDQIERVEVLRGAASTLYGADAMTGVINIITKKPKERKLSASVEAGDYEYHNHGLNLSNEHVNIGFNYQHLTSIHRISESFTRHYYYDLDSANEFSGSLNVQFMDKLFFDFMGGYVDTGFRKYSTKTGSLKEGTDQDHYKFFANLRWEDDRLRTKAFFYEDIMVRDKYTVPNYDEDDNRNYNGGVELNYRLDLFGGSLVAGGDSTFRAADYSNKYGYHDRMDYAVYLEYKKTFSEKFTATVGFREQFVDADSEGKDYDKFLPSFGINYALNDYLNVFANAGKAFRSPTFNQLYYSSSFLVGNPNLQPETGWTFEGGVKFDNEFSSLRLAAFYMTYKNKIVLDRSRGYPLTYFNAGDYDDVGIEWEFEVEPFENLSSPLRHLSFFASGFWADPEAEDVKGEKFQVGPRVSAALGVNYTTDGFQIGLNTNIMASRERGLEDSCVVNLNAKFKLFKGYLTVAVDNITDERTEIAGDKTSLASNRYVYYGMPRLVKVGYVLNF